METPRNPTWELLETLKPFVSKPDGVLQEIQVFQLNAYPVYYFGDENAKTEVDLTGMVVRYTFTPDKRLKKQQLNLNKDYITRSVKALLGDSWTTELVQVKAKKAV